MFARSAAIASMVLLVQAVAVRGYVINDFDGTSGLGYEAAGGSTLTEVNAAGDADEELRIVTGTTANFTQYVKWPGIGRTGALMDALQAGTAVEVDVLAFDAELTGNLRLGLVVNTNAWTTVGGGYRRVAQVNVNDGGDTNTTLSWASGLNADFQAMLDNFASGGGTFLEFYFDNTGFPGIASPQTFYVDDFVVVIPEPASLALLCAGALVMLRRRG